MDGVCILFRFITFLGSFGREDGRKHACMSRVHCVQTDGRGFRKMEADSGD